MRTVNGHSVFDAVSAMQKCVRRGLPEDALAWALELVESDYAGAAFSRLRVTLWEDVSVGDIARATFAAKALDDTHAWFYQTPQQRAWRLSLASAIIAMCQAQKSRDSDNLQAIVRHRRGTGPPLEMPDFAKDLHTLAGKQMGRGLDHFLTEGTLLVPDGSNPDWKTRAPPAYAWLKAQKALAKAQGIDVKTQPYETLVKRGKVRSIESWLPEEEADP